MADDDTLEIPSTEVELPEPGVVATVMADEIDANNDAIRDLLKSIEDKNFTQAEKQFNDEISDRLQNTLDQAKMKIAGQIFNGEEPDEEEPENDELDDYEDQLIADEEAEEDTEEVED